MSFFKLEVKYQITSAEVLSAREGEDSLETNRCEEAVRKGRRNLDAYPLSETTQWVYDLILLMSSAKMTTLSIGGGNL